MSIPVYVRVNKQEVVLDTIDDLKEQLLSAKKLLHEIYDLRSEENKHLHLVKQRIMSVNEKISLAEEKIR
jgi:hypothetical protein